MLSAYSGPGTVLGAPRDNTVLTTVSEVIVSSSYGRGDRGAEGLSGQHSHHPLLLRLQSSRDCVRVAVGRAGICHVLVKR